MKEKTGIVTTLYPERCKARVKFNDRDDMVSDELQIVVRGSLTNKDYWMPKVGEEVYCSFTEQKRGYILGSVYSESDPPPVMDESKRYVEFEDGTTIEYDTKTSTLSIICKGPVNVEATGNINVKGDVIAEGISLKGHTHMGVHGETTPPIGGE